MRATVPATTMRSVRRVWLLCVVFGLATIGFAVWFTSVIPTATCSGPLPAGISALVAFQLARTPEAIERVFGPAGSPCRASMVAALDRANTVDLIGFIAVYGAFLAAFLLAMRRAGAGAAARWGLGALAAGLAFDVVETVTQLRLTRDLPGGTGALAMLAIASREKFAALALVCLCAGVAMVERGRLAGRAAGLGVIAGAGLAVIGLAHPPARALLTLGNTLAWLLVWLYASAAAVRER